MREKSGIRARSLGKQLIQKRGATHNQMTTISSEDARLLVAGRHQDPFSVLGLHQNRAYGAIRAFVPQTDSIVAIDPVSGNSLCELLPVANAPGLFEGQSDALNSRDAMSVDYRLQVIEGSRQRQVDDPYRFPPVLGELDEHLLAEGAHLKLWQVLGAHVMTHLSVRGTHFGVWAPNACRVSVVGDFNGWDGRCHCMRGRGQTGVWEIFLPDVLEGEPYKFELLDGNGNLLPQKADPVGFRAEHPPRTASVVTDISGYCWKDASWINRRAELQQIDQPITVYEVHVGSWKQVPEAANRPMSYLELADSLVSYVSDMGFTHIELMPVSEFPFDGSWGYQPVGLYAPSIRYGTASEFRTFIEACHAAGLGVILDWVPGHFPEDEHGLGKFDGTALYEHADRREGFHPDWNTLVYNYGRREVANYLCANALYWLSEYHVDGLRVDAVASMLYRDYSRRDGEWVPNAFGGRENLEAIQFLQQFNELSYARETGIMTIAEESTAFPGVCEMTTNGGLGFGLQVEYGAG